MEKFGNPLFGGRHRVPALSKARLPLTQSYGSSWNLALLWYFQLGTYHTPLVDSNPGTKTLETLTAFLQRATQLRKYLATFCGSPATIHTCSIGRSCSNTVWPLSRTSWQNSIPFKEKFQGQNYPRNELMTKLDPTYP